jgi:parvulin-like peptidyl-prolyl isomerase
MRLAPVARIALGLALTGVLAGPGCSKKDAPADADAEAAKPAAADTPATPEKEAAPAEPVQEADPNEACVKLLAVAHTELEEERRPEGVRRDKEAAKAHAEALRAKLEGGADFLALVASDSDDARTKSKKGGMGTYTKEKWPEPYEPFKAPVFALKIGERSGVLDTPFGFAIVERCPIDKVHTRHILIRYAGAKRADDDVKRTRDEAKAEATKIREAIAGGEDFAEVAKERGEDGTAERGGDLGPIGKGMFAIGYEEAAWALGPGELAEVVETDFGFHVIQRLTDEEAAKAAAAAKDEDEG